MNVNGTLFFTAFDSTNGYELWKSDGTSSGTLLVKDIRTGAYSSYPSYLTNVNGTLFFRANDGTNGYELWKSNGTAATTLLVKDIRSGSANSYPANLTNVNGTLFFRANDGTNGYELWKSNGTAATTVLVKDIRSGTANSYPAYLTNLNGTLLFRANNGTTGYELWKSDGTSSGTVLVKDIRSGSSNSYPRNLKVFDGHVYFRATDGTTGYELWCSDGTSSGTVLVQDMRSGTTGSYPFYFTSSNGKLFFSVDDGVKGRELWTLVNTAPVLNGVPASATLAELAAYTFTASATDADLPAQALTFSLVDFDASNKVPAGATIGGSTGVFSWTPTEAQGPGTYKFKVSVSDGVTSTAQTIVLTVSEVNSAPVLSGVPASATIPELAAYTFTANATDADLPAQTLAFSLMEFDANNQVPAAATIGGSTGVFNWTPTEAQGPGTYKFKVSVSDGVTSTAQTIVLTVSEVNTAPVLSGVPASATIPELAAYTFTASATDSDVPAQTLTFSLVDFDASNRVPAGATIGGSTGVFSWTPTEAQGPGTYTFNVSVSDGVTSTAQAIVLTVSEGNTAPVLSGVPASATIPELAAYTFTASATDADLPAQTLTFSAGGL